MENNEFQNMNEGIWVIDKNGKTATRKNGDKLINIPINKEILEEVNRQTEALTAFMAFINIDYEDKFTIMYLKVMLEHYYNYLSIYNKNFIIKVMKNIASNDYFNEENTNYINIFCNLLEDNNMEEFENKFREFEEYNKVLFEELYIERLNELNIENNQNNIEELLEGNA